MATRLLDRVPLERIEQRARPVNLGRALVTLVVGVFYALGWLAGKVVLVAGVALGWAWAAAAEGYADGRKPTEGPPRAGPA
jgi:hypothetical protein